MHMFGGWLFILIFLFIFLTTVMISHRIVDAVSDQSYSLKPMGRSRLPRDAPLGLQRANEKPLLPPQRESDAQSFC